MTEPTLDIQHFQGSTAHGPVLMYLADDGQVVFGCTVDKTSWKLDGLLLVTPPPPVDSVAPPAPDLGYVSRGGGGVAANADGDTNHQVDSFNGGPEIRDESAAQDDASVDFGDDRVDIMRRATSLFD